ncbi:NAD(P)-dependent oxidoreductase [Dactylosporangium aurantiacum]|uniref:NAD(P)-dependent oxidoreductase n=1 Tax=Dactylosporangium aurantiacum TaxID=35754 RepID=A0A9Q9ML79_9ACTN|nr:NAD(P)-dependent oxidoreductase [Dactylosporangium aurantiacum]MDG6110442.1 NAD(P)-dependent oxidoreductase [Dactylosporangium aurantiacum]UWZ58675.1 NAD(P)-dependent oxidoreductase [Dactylosporangium aurantiacum]
MKIAVLGLGAMGSRMARRLLATGEHEITAWNRAADATRPLVEAGATAAPTPAAAAEQCDLVLAMLRDDDAGRSVWLDPDTGALTTMAAGAAAVDCSTVTPAFSAELAARCTHRGVDFLDAPVLGSRPQADAGALIFLVGGQPAVARRVEPVLRQLGGAVHHMGQAGTGARMKLLANSLFAVQVAAVAELLGAVDGTDLDASRVVEVLTATPVASPAAATAATAMLGPTFPAAFPVELVAKDLRYAVADAAARDRPVPLTGTAAATFQQALDRGYGGDNITGVVQLFWPDARAG